MRGIAGPAHLVIPRAASQSRTVSSKAVRHRDVVDRFEESEKAALLLILAVVLVVDDRRAPGHKARHLA